MEFLIRIMAAALLHFLIDDIWNMMDNDTMTKGAPSTAAFLLTNDAMVFYDSEFFSNEMG
jgi:hypothetical protein